MIGKQHEKDVRNPDESLCGTRTAPGYTVSELSRFRFRHGKFLMGSKEFKRSNVFAGESASGVLFLNLGSGGIPLSGVGGCASQGRPKGRS